MQSWKLKGISMSKREHDLIWRRWAKKKDFTVPDKLGLELCWACIGVPGRFCPPEDFAIALYEDDGYLGEEIIFECEANLN